MGKKNFVAGILDRKPMIILIMILLLIGGLVSYVMIPKQHFPKVIVPVAAVSVVYPGASAEELEELVAKPVEQKCMELNGYDNCTTNISENVSTTSVVLNMNLSQDEVDDAWDDLRLKMNALQSELPSGVSYIRVDDDIMDVAGVLVAVSGDNISNDELNQRTNVLADDLRDIGGVSKVSISGNVASEIKIVVDSSKLNNQSVSMAEIATLIGAQNKVVPTGSIKVDDNKISVDATDRFKTVDDIGNLVIGASDSGVITRLKDIATITTDVPEDDAYYLYNKQKSDVIAVYFDDSVNAVSLADVLTKTIDDYSKTLPEGITANTVYFQPTDVNTSVNGFIVNLIESIVLVILVIMVGMNLRNAFVISFAMPLAILGNFIVMKLFGLDIHFVSLAGLVVVLGMLVDNAVVVSDSIQTQLDAGLDKRNAVIEGTSSVIVPVFVSMLTTVAAFASLLTLPGAYHQLAFTFPSVIITCLVLSFLVSIVITPLMCYFFLKKKEPKKNEKGDGKLIDTYNKVSAWTFNHKLITFVSSFAIIVVGLLLATQLGFEVVPKAYKDVITITVNGTNDSSLSKTREVIDNVEKVLDEQPETKYYLAGVGKAIPRYDYSIRPLGQGNALGDFSVKIDLKKGGRFKTTSEMVDYLQDELSSRVGGATFMVDELGIMSLTAKPIEVKLYSDNLDDLNSAAQQVNDMLASIPGTKGIINDNEVNTYNYYVDMDTLKLNTLGLTKAEAQNELSYALLGRTVSQFKNGNKEYNIVLDSDIDSREQIQDFKVKSSISGKKYAVNQFANVDLNPKITTITRANGKRGRVVGCYNSTKYSDIDMQNKLTKMLKKADFPDTVTIEETGERKDYMELMGHIATAAGVSLIVMLLLLMYQFGTMKKVAIVFTSIPFGLCAGFIALYVTGEKLALFALLGAVSLLGCVLANAIVLVEFINDELASGLPLEDACKSAGGKRVRPIMMSTMTTVLGLLPLALFGDAMFVPMAVLMMAGLAVSMCINLVLVPMIYYLAYKKKYKKLEQQNAE
ncbi:MAG: efflux RND transporter permease subunit [Eubacterium sp.]|nr:efflux RND transporter permease subunit [Eubacterium sp.]